MERFASSNYTYSSTCHSLEIMQLPLGDMEIENSRQVLAAVWASSPDAWVLSDADGIVLDANPAYLNLYNLTRQQTIGAPFNIIFPEEFRSEAQAQYEEVFASAPPNSTFETEFTKENKTKLVDTTISFLTENGRRVAMLSCIRDVTKHKRRQDELALRSRYEHALAQCSRILLQSQILRAEDNENEKSKVLNAALQPLLSPSQAKTIVVHRNIEDPDLGLCGQALAALTDPVSIDLQTAETTQETLAQFRRFLRQQIPAIAARPDEFISTVFPWSIIPDELLQRLAAGQWIGGPIAQLYADAPAYRDFLLNQHQLYMLLVFPIHIGGQWWGTISMTEWENKPIEAEDEIKRRVAYNARDMFWTEDEIVLLGTAAEMVSSALQRWQVAADLRDLNQQLEERVEDRTAELRKAVEQLRKEVAERKRAEVKLQRMVELLEQRVAERSRELAALYDMTILFTGAHNLEDTLEPALHNIGSSVDAQGIAVHILSADESHLRLTAHGGLTHGQQMEAVEVTSEFAHWLNQTEEPLMFVGDTANYPFFPKALLPATAQTYFGIALRVRQRVIGFLGVYRDSKQPFSLQNVSFLITMAEQLGIIVENQRLQEQSLQMTQIVERQQLARQLHDSVAQRIYSLHLFARAGHDALADGEREEALLRLEQLDKNALYALREMRLLLYQLRPLALESQSLSEAFDHRFEMVERRLGIEATVQQDTTAELAEAVEEELFYVITEALNNALKHAEATEVKLSFADEDGRFLVTVQDNGRGFDWQQSKPGIGLENMCFRTESIGGLVTVETAAGEGTVVRITI